VPGAPVYADTSTSSRKPHLSRTLAPAAATYDGKLRRSQPVPHSSRVHDLRVRSDFLRPLAPALPFALATDIAIPQKFKSNGCPNCIQVLQNLGSDVVDDITSPVFEGLVALREPARSWVARWQRVDGFVPGMYAVKVSGNVRLRIPYRCRA
jgi:hypothetical protein